MVWVLLLCLPLLCPAVIIDRVAVTVGNQVITESALELEIRLTAFLNAEPLKLNAQTRQQAANRLIEQKLVKRELEFGRYPLPGVKEAEPRLEAIRKRSSYRQALETYGITEEDLRQFLLWQLQFLKFIDLRFRPGVQVSEPQIEEYFKTHILSLQQIAHPGKPVVLGDYRQQIEETLTGQLVDKELNSWLKEVRGRTHIEFKEDVFK